MSKIGSSVLNKSPYKKVWEYGKGWRVVDAEGKVVQQLTQSSVQKSKPAPKLYGKCPVCGDPYSGFDDRGSQKGFKGAKYGMKVYEHPDKECVYQTAYYPDYFGKGPKTKVDKWTTKKG